MNKFKTFIEMAELKSQLTGSNLEFYSKIIFSKKTSDYYYGFDNIEVWFIKDVMPVGYSEEQILTKKVYEINFFDEKGNVEPKKDKAVPAKSLSVYKKVALVVRKFLEVNNPEGLMFSGYVPEQQKIYDLIYKLLLADKFTRISYTDYLRNDVFREILSKDSPRKSMLLKMMGSNEI